MTLYGYLMRSFYLSNSEKCCGSIFKNKFTRLYLRNQGLNDDRQISLIPLGMERRCRTMKKGLRCDNELATCSSFEKSLMPLR